MKPILNSKYSLAGASMALAVILGGCVAVETTETAEAETATEEAVAVTETVEEELAVVQETVEEAVAEVEEMTAEAKLAAVLAAQPEEVQARFGARNPAETLAFFGVEPGMTVAEALPGGGWYSKILISYLGDEHAAARPIAKLIGANYPDDLWGKFVMTDCQVE